MFIGSRANMSQRAQYGTISPPSPKLTQSDLSLHLLPGLLLFLGCCEGFNISV